MSIDSLKDDARKLRKAIRLEFSDKTYKFNEEIYCNLRDGTKLIVTGVSNRKLSGRVQGSNQPFSDVMVDELSLDDQMRLFDKI